MELQITFLVYILLEYAYVFTHSFIKKLNWINISVSFDLFDLVRKERLTYERSNEVVSLSGGVHSVSSLHILCCTWTVRFFYDSSQHKF
jgi:hypothetical protein